MSRILKELFPKRKKNVGTVVRDGLWQKYIRTAIKMGKKSSAQDI